MHQANKSRVPVSKATGRPHRAALLPLRQLNPPFISANRTI